ncbi:hypothetical protein [Parapedobacter defluvii]|uniref:hypothetical protein n=1 Tax=Parapedobacter defluvii TaxID=2045106 RepID=UPI00333ED3FE
MAVLPYFFYLQAKRIHRAIDEWGINPWLVYVGAPVLFFGGSIALFSRMVYASWVYVGVAAVALLQLCNSTRLRFLRQAFDRRTYRRVRMLEHTLLVTPFLAFLLCRGEIWFALGLLVLAAATIPLRIGTARSATLPTPFSGRPFEFAVGFRTSVGSLFIAYGLMVIGMYVGNGYLSIATLLLVVLICFNYYAWSEPLLYVWIYRLPPRSFLLLKVRTAFRYLTVMLLPMVLVVICVFPDYWPAVLAVAAMGYGYLVLAVMSKYAAFPQRVGILQGIFITLSLVFPPLLVISIPYFYQQAKNNIALIL